jgi:hypothetical protein
MDQNRQLVGSWGQLTLKQPLCFLSKFGLFANPFLKRASLADKASQVATSRSDLETKVRECCLAGFQVELMHC